ncbi:RDD family protein [Rubrolithibacter danxiaensis]|uniref:RDD family protein n=1 Tax=Rubrolithibacter danxiaensis TaxID=3390805 RepID=UPI003BF86BF6
MIHQYKTNLKKRILATLLDYLIFGLLTYLYFGFFGEVNEQGGFELYNLMLLPIVVLWTCYFVVVEGLKGATFGHQALNLKVLTVKGDEIGFTEAFLRHILDLIDIYIYGIPALVAIKFTDRHQRLGDLVAKTVMVDLDDETQYKEKVPRKIFESKTSH